MRLVKPPKAVEEVQCDDRWHPGQLGAGRRDDDGWRAYVRYTGDVGITYLWVDSVDARPL
jgi:hypothetical protein